MKTRVHGPADMSRFASEFITALAASDAVGAATILTLSGELGAGKTTFVQAAAKTLGVEETVNSPTFVIEKIYTLSGQKWQRLIHIDAYRLKSADELHALGWDNIVVDPANLIIIEWPAHVDGVIPENAHRIVIEVEEGEQRVIQHDH